MPAQAAPAASPWAFPETVQRPVSALGWGLVFGGGAVIWAGIFALIS
jgi:hypothetical protein